MTLRITKKKIIFRKEQASVEDLSCLSCKENKNEDNKNWSRLTWLRFAIAEQRGVHVDEEDHAAEVEVKVEPFVERRRYVGGYYFGHGKGDSHYDQQLPVESAKSRRKGVAVQQTETIVVSTVERERWTERERAVAAIFHGHFSSSRPSPPWEIEDWYFLSIPTCFRVRLPRRSFSLLPSSFFRNSAAFEIGMKKKGTSRPPERSVSGDTIGRKYIHPRKNWLNYG